MTTPNIEKTKALLHEIRLKHWADNLDKELDPLKPQERALVTDLLNKWIKNEKSKRYETLIQNRIRSAKFKRIETIDSYDFKHNKAAQAIEKSYLELFNSISLDNPSLRYL